VTAAPAAITTTSGSWYRNRKKTKMANFKLNIKTDNAAFDGDNRDAEVVRILREIAANIEQGREAGVVRDINGNRVGTYGHMGDE